MFRPVAGALVLVMEMAACSQSDRAPSDGRSPDAPLDAARVDASSATDAAPPSAPPPPVIACSKRMPCELPASICVDEHYLVYYSGGACVNKVCELTANLMYCDICHTDPSTGQGGCISVGT